MPREPKLYRAIHARVPALPGSGIGRSELRKGSARSGGSKHVAGLGETMERSLKSASGLPGVAKLAERIPERERQCRLRAPWRASPKPRGANKTAVLA